jgi:HEAT repeat protein
MAFLRECSSKARVLAVRALAEIGDERAVQTFYDLLDNESMLVQYWANEVLSGWELVWSSSSPNLSIPKLPTTQ